MVNMKHNDWFTQTTKSDTVNAVANKAGIVQRTLARQIERGHIDAENAIKIAIAYNVHPVRALVDTGYLEEKYAQEVDITTAIQTADEMVIVDEVLRRMRKGEASENFTKPADQVGKERKLKALSDADDMNDGTVRPFDYSEYAADSSEDETEARLERGEDLID